MTRTLRIYADTSVFGGCFDDEFASASRSLFEEIKARRFRLLVSATTLRELQRAPEPVRLILAELPDDVVEMIEPDDEIDRLRDAYVDAGVVASTSLLDAEHIAAATVVEADLIVSWNFKHIVHFEKIRGYHAVNMLRGHPATPIHSPLEVIES